MRNAVSALEGSRIREVANEGLGREGVLKFWFGESDEVTPAFIREAAIASLQAGDTFYAHNLGLPELREALRAYTAGLHGNPGPDRIAVTSSGVTALRLFCHWAIFSISCFKLLLGDTNPTIDKISATFFSVSRSSGESFNNSAPPCAARSKIFLVLCNSSVNTVTMELMVLALGPLRNSISRANSDSV